MKLKSLDIQGYKSFALKTTLLFDQGITAVVGPNGSGKSNVSDAIRWVLGEQSYSLLRGQKTADMIFAGSTNRSRMGMASVSIVLDNTDNSLPLDYAEVTITRRAYRSGENEYLINNNRVRLKDITELLARGGLARQTYTSIGQGTIDRALSLRAEERRQLFEEAAGITFHRQRRAVTLRSLDETHANLLRLNDIVKEIEPRLKRLQRQAEKVEQYHIIRLHLDGLLKVWYGYLWGEKQESLHRIKVHTTISQEHLAEEHAALVRLEETIKDLRTRQTDLRSRLGDWHMQSSTLHRQAEAVQRELAVGEERARQLSAQREEFLTERQTLQVQLTVEEAEVTTAQQTLASMDETCRQAENTLQTVQKKLNAHRQQQQTLLHRQSQIETRLRRLQQTLTEQQIRQQQLTERQTELQTQKTDQQQAISILQTQKTDLADQLKTIKTRLEHLDTAQQALTQQEIALQQQHRTLNDQAQILARRVTTAEKELSARQTQQDMLAKLRSGMTGYHQGIKFVLQNQNLPGIRGTVAQLLQVPAHLETAIEMALSSRLQDIVVNTWHNAETAIEHLKKNHAGRATFLPLDRLRPPAPLEIPQTDGVIGLAANLVTCEPDIQPAAQNLLNRLLITTTLPAARLAFDVLSGGFQIATQQGELVRSGGAITGGETANRQDEGGILAREREWRELPAQLEADIARLADLNAQLAQNTAAQSTLEVELSQFARQNQDLSRQITTVRHDQARCQSSLSELTNQIAWRNDLTAQAEKELQTNHLRQQQAQEEIIRLNREYTAVETELTALIDQIAAFSTENLQAELAQAQTQTSLAHQQQQNQRQMLKTCTTALNQTQTRINSRQSRIETLAQQRSDLLTHLETQRHEHIILMNRVKEFTALIEPAEESLHQLETAQQTTEVSEQKQRDNVRRLETEFTRYNLELNRRQSAIETLQRQIEDDFGLVQLELSEDQTAQPVLPLQSVVTQLPVIDKLPEGIEEDIRHLKVEMRQLGNINLDAPQEFAELQERFTFLTTQMADLETAAQNLKKIIAELDTIMEQAFKTTFTRVAREFQTYFKILFNGGEAQLELTNPDDLTQTGVDIIARPPDKRPQNLELLSGGERSLTAQALIFALLKTSPTPYCLFDEVDAMLDEANVDRFRQALTDLSRDIQFIIITHNRKTIEIAQTIYGISMGNDAISRVVSLKLDDIPENQPA